MTEPLTPAQRLELADQLAKLLDELPPDPGNTTDQRLRDRLAAYIHGLRGELPGRDTRPVP